MQKTLPKAIKRVYIRILFFYVLGTFVISLLVSSADPKLNLSSGTAASSPFVIAIVNSGIPALPSIVNAGEYSLYTYARHSKSDPPSAL